MMMSDNNEVFENMSKFISNLPNLLSDRMDLACIMVESKAKQEVPVDDGQLRQSITHTVEIENTDVKGYIGSNVEYAPYVHEGTGIYAKNGDGRQTPWIYPTADGKFVKTEGQKPKPFLQDAVSNSQQELIEKFKDLF